jgi:hypothetical protein
MFKLQSEVHLFNLHIQVINMGKLESSQKSYHLNVQS